MTEFVTNTLKEMGAAGAAISVLLTAVTALVTAVVVLYRQNLGNNKARLAENGILIKLLEANNTALNRNSQATEERNKVTQELAEAIAKQAAAFEMVNQRVAFYHESNTEKLKDIREVVAASAEAVRVNTGMVTEVRNGNLQIQGILQDLKAISRRRRTS